MKYKLSQFAPFIWGAGVLGFTGWCIFKNYQRETLRRLTDELFLREIERRALEKEAEHWKQVLNREK